MTYGSKPIPIADSTEWFSHSSPQPIARQTCSAASALERMLIGFGPNCQTMEIIMGGPTLFAEEEGEEGGGEEFHHNHHLHPSIRPTISVCSVCVPTGARPRRARERASELGAIRHSAAKVSIPPSKLANDVASLDPRSLSFKRNAPDVDKCSCLLRILGSN